MSIQLTTIKRLYARSSNQCAFPKCTAPIIVDGIQTGEICHIKARRKNGPRYDATLSTTDRDSYANLLLLCRTCHNSSTQIPIDIRQSCLRTSSVYTKQGVIVKLHHKWLMMHSCSSHHPQSDPRLRLKPAATGLQLQLVEMLRHLSRSTILHNESHLPASIRAMPSDQCKYGWLCGLLVRTGSGLLGEHPDDDARAPWQEDQNQVSPQN